MGGTYLYSGDAELLADLSQHGGVNLRCVSLPGEGEEVCWKVLHEPSVLLDPLDCDALHWVHLV